MFSITASRYVRALSFLIPKTKHLGLLRKVGREKVYKIIYA